jgi:hypothetical protein
MNGVTANITTVNATTVDATNVEVTNVKAKDGTAAIVISNTSGNVGIGGAAAAGRRLDITGTLPEASGFTIPYNLRGTIPSTATTVYGYYSTPTTEAASFTLTNLNHFFANPPAFGAGSTVTNQYGFIAGSTLTGATNNYGFYGNIASGSNRYNVYMAGTADNYFAGNVGVGTASPQGKFQVLTAGSLASDTDSNTGAIIAGTDLNATSSQSNLFIYSNSTATDGYGGSIGFGGLYTGTSVAAFGRIAGVRMGGSYWGGLTFYTRSPSGTMPEQMRIDSSGNVGIGTTTPDARLDVDAGATALAARVQGTNSPYLSVLDNDNTVEALVAADGSASATVFGSITNHAVQFRTNNSERMRIDSSGNVGIGVTTFGNRKLETGGTLPSSGGYSYAVLGAGTFPSGATTEANCFTSFPATQAASFTIPALNHFIAVQSTFGASSVVTNQYGFRVDSSLTGATNNYGFFSNIASGSNRWNFYAAGTADNYFAGNTGVGVVPLADTRLRVRGSDATSSNYAIVLQNSTPASLFYVRNDGLMFTGLAANSPYNVTTANAANVEIANDGIMRRSTSSLRYKSDVVNATHGLADVLKLRSVTYKGKNDGDRIFGGLIAEEVHEAGLTEFVAYDKEGRPDAIHYGNMVALLVKAVQELTARVAELEAK